MKFALENLAFDTLTIVDSDQLGAAVIWNTSRALIGAPVLVC